MTPEITFAGLLMLPISCALFLRRPKAILPLAIVSSIFIPMSVINITGGSFDVGISLWFWCGLLIAAREIPTLITRSHLYPPALAPLFLFVVYVTIAGLFLPTFFNGILVSNPRATVDGASALVPLEFSTSIFGQIGYLIINCLVVAAALRRRSDLLESLHLSLMIFGFFFVYQVIAKNIGIYFPTEILLSNPTYYVGAGQSLDGGIPRISSTFSEPSNAGAFLSAFLAYFITARRMFAAAICTIGMLITTSSTAYLMLVLIWLAYLSTQIFGSLFKGRITLAILFQILLIIVSAALLSFSLEKLLSIILFEKSESGSFLDRTALDLRGIEVFIETFGLGVGLGGNRPSSFLIYCLSNIGIWGTTLFIWFLLRIGRHISPNHKPMVALLWTFIAAKVVAAPDFTEPTLWAFIAVLASLHGITARSHKALEPVTAQTQTDSPSSASAA